MALVFVAGLLVAVGCGGGGSTGAPTTVAGTAPTTVAGTAPTTVANTAPTNASAAPTTLSPGVGAGATVPGHVETFDAGAVPTCTGPFNGNDHATFPPSLFRIGRDGSGWAWCPAAPESRFVAGEIDRVIVSGTYGLSPLIVVHDARTGVPLWSQPGASDGGVPFVDSGGTVYTLAAGTTARLDVHTGAEISEPVSPGQVVMVTAGAVTIVTPMVGSTRSVSALDTVGAQRWTRDDLGQVSGVTGTDPVIVEADRGTTALDPASGATRWHVDDALAAVEGDVVLTGNSGSVTAHALSDGKQLWMAAGEVVVSHQGPRSAVSSVVLVRPDADSAAFTALDRASGAPLWSHHSTGFMASGDGIVVFDSADIVDARTGAPLAAPTVPCISQDSCTATGGYVAGVVVDDGGVVFAVNAFSGS